MDASAEIKVFTALNLSLLVVNRARIHSFIQSSQNVRASWLEIYIDYEHPRHRLISTQVDARVLRRGEGAPALRRGAQRARRRRLRAARLVALRRQPGRLHRRRHAQLLLSRGPQLHEVAKRSACCASRRTSRPGLVRDAERASTSATTSTRSPSAPSSAPRSK